MTNRPRGSGEFCFYRHSNKHAAFGGATCVQSFDDSQTSAIHITYHISLCSSSLHEPRDPSLKVVSWFLFFYNERHEKEGEDEQTGNAKSSRKEKGNAEAASLVQPAFP